MNTKTRSSKLRDGLREELQDKEPRDELEELRNEELQDELHEHQDELLDEFQDELRELQDEEPQDEFQESSRTSGVARSSKMSSELKSTHLKSPR